MSSRAERAAWPARLVSGPDPGEPAHDLSPEEAWLAIGQLTRAVWEQMGRPIPSVPRSQWPARLFARGEPRDDGDPSDDWNTDFLELVDAFLAAKVDFLVVGAFALAQHGYLRTTADIAPA